MQSTLAGDDAGNIIDSGAFPVGRPLSPLRSLTEGLLMSPRLPLTSRWLSASPHAIVVRVGAGVTWAALWAVLSLPAAHAADMAEVTVTLTTHQQGTAPPVTAIGLQATGPAAETAPTRICLLVDTSASQAGPVLAQAVTAARGFLEQTRPTDTVMLGAIDVAYAPLHDQFELPASDALNAAMTTLADRTPLGNTDLLGGLQSAIEAISQEAGPAAIVYLGDGPGLTSLLPADFAATVAALREQRISFSAITIGPQVNWPCLAALAAGTGGTVLSPAPDQGPLQAGQTLAQQVTAPILWPDDSTLTLTSTAKDASLGMLPFQLPPLRQDRESFVLLLGPMAPAAVEVTVEATPTVDRPKAWPEATLTFAIPQREASSDNAFLEQLARNAFDTGGIFLPLLGREGFDLAGQVIRDEASTLARLSRQAEASGAHAAAARLAAASLQRDPDNADAAIIQAAVSKATAAPIKPVAQVAQTEERSAARRPDTGSATLPRPQTDDDRAAAQAQEELREIENAQRIRSQLLERETAIGLRNARHLMASDPDAARIELKNLQQQVRDAADLDEALRDRLERQIEISLREAIVRSQEKLERDLAIERTRAAARERARIAGELQRREDKFSQLAERFRAIVAQESSDGITKKPDIYAPAGELTRDLATEMQLTAPPTRLSGDLPITARTTAAQASELAEILRYDNHNKALRRSLQRGFMDTLALADDSAIPYPDEPPVRYPDVAEWRRISTLREKWKSVNLAGDSPGEENIYKALRNTVDLDFTNGVSLREFEAALEATLGVPVKLDERVLAGELGLDVNEPDAIRGAYRGISGRSALRRLLSNVFETPLTYVVRDEVLLITDKQYAADNYLSVKVYPVGDLVIPPGQPLNSNGGASSGPGANFGNQQNQGGGLGGGGGFQ